MDPESRGLRALGAAIADTEAAFLEGRAGVEHPAARRRLLDALAHRPSVAPRLAAALVGAALVVTLLVYAVRDRGRPQSGPGPAAEPAAAEWLAAPRDAPLPAILGDGTELLLGPAARARVDHGEDAATAITLESGDLHVHMPPRPGARRHVDAGPFRVVVTGTEFIVRWAPVEERFELAVVEGTVLVHGPLVEGRSVRAGQTVRVRGRSQLEVTEEPRETPAAVSDAPATIERPSTPLEPDAGSRAPIEIPAVEAGPPEPAKVAVVEPTPARAQPDWLALAAQRRHAEALASARAAGLDRLCEELPADELARLADVARYAGDADAATTALQTLRRRFPGTADAAEAAFTFGRMMFDARGNSLAAAAWFETYLREAPGGRWEQEALGRLVDAYDASSSPAAAGRAARRYLDRFPDGPHAELARRLAGP